ncbi:hypothetical protein DB346_07310 [Verrucomicrobia bacterium LW23]|nr:hypothetical protein DB346_07310 [Verrucomicrobia bacterium LW23]
MRSLRHFRPDWTLLGVGAVLTVIGLTLTSITGWQLLLGWQSEHFVRTTGVLLESRATGYPKPHGSLAVVYQFEVDGVTYQGNQASAQDSALKGTPNNNAATLARRFPAGAPVVIYYDAANPARSLLQPGVTADQMRRISFCLTVMLPFGLMLVSYALRDALEARPGVFFTIVKERELWILRASFSVWQLAPRYLTGTFAAGVLGMWIISWAELGDPVHLVAVELSMLLLVTGAVRLYNRMNGTVSPDIVIDEHLGTLTLPGGLVVYFYNIESIEIEEQASGLPAHPNLSRPARIYLRITGVAFLAELLYSPDRANVIAIAEWLAERLKVPLIKQPAPSAPQRA